MNTWNEMDWLIKKAEAKGYRSYFKPFKDGEKVGHNSHYRFIWVKAWWVALFGDDYELFAQKALHIALEEGPSHVIHFMYEAKREYDKKEEDNQE